MNYYCGGYFLIEQQARPSYVNTDIVPSTILSVSSCISTTYPNGFNWFAKYNQEMNKEIIEIRKKWMGIKVESDQMGWPDVFFDLETAREFYRKFLFPFPKLRCIGIGLKVEFVKDFLDYHLSNGEGISKCLARKRFLNDKGKFLGYEVLGYDSCVLHSFLCNGLEEELPRFGIILNSEGLISTFEQAVKLSEYFSSMDGLEAELYFPWVLKEYELHCLRHRFAMKSRPKVCKRDTSVTSKLSVKSGSGRHHDVPNQ